MNDSFDPFGDPSANFADCIHDASPIATIAPPLMARTSDGSIMQTPFLQAPPNPMTTTTHPNFVTPHPQPHPPHANANHYSNHSIPLVLPHLHPNPSPATPYSPADPCPICHSSLSAQPLSHPTIRLHCLHSFHRACITEAIKHVAPGAEKCPCCRAAIDTTNSPFFNVDRYVVEGGDGNGNGGGAGFAFAPPQPVLLQNPTSYQIMARHASAREAVRRRMQSAIEASRLQGVPVHTLYVTS